MTKTEKNDLLKYFIGIGALYFLVVKPIFQKVGIEKTKDERGQSQTIKNLENQPTNKNPFSGKLFLRGMPRGTRLLTEKSSKGLAKALYSAFSIFGDNESKAFGIFRQFRTQAQVAQMVSNFYDMYTLDLYNFLKNGKPGFFTTPFTGLNNNELNIIINIINKLPKF